ncbi:MAG: DUF6364 family protein [Flavobacteriales bacterium]|jgi:hypothetical protein|nr:DUF6364 family protein [Flavobacteriales bacterium]
MKTKLTLSIDESVVRKARAHSKRTGLSVSAMVEEYLRSIAGSTGEGSWARSVNGSMADGFTEESVERNDRLGFLLRKYAGGRKAKGRAA